MRTVFTVGTGFDVNVVRRMPWVEPFWSDNGRLSGDRFDPSTWHNIYFEAAVLARINCLAPVLRGVHDVGFRCVPLLRDVADAFDAGYAEAGYVPPTFVPFIDTNAMGDVVSLPDQPIPFDFANDSHLELIWNDMLEPFLRVVEHRLERTKNGRVLVAWWGLGPGVIGQGKLNWASAQRLLDHLSNRMEETGFGRPDHIIDTSWPSSVQAYGKHAWFHPPLGWSVHYHNGVTTGVAVPGFIDPSNPNRRVPREDGHQLRRALVAWRNAGVEYGFLEGFTDIEESAGFYRSDVWTPRTLYLDIVREHIGLTSQPAPSPEPVTPIPVPVIGEDDMPKAAYQISRAASFEHPTKPGYFATWYPKNQRFTVLSIQADGSLGKRLLHAPGPAPGEVFDPERHGLDGEPRAWETWTPNETGDKATFPEAVEAFGIPITD